MGIPQDREQWSESSKRSAAGLGSARQFYTDIIYRCAKCTVWAKFSAQEQQFVFEVKKQYIWKRRTLCPDCNSELFRLKTAEQACQAHWAKARASARHDREFLSGWLQVLRAIQSFPGTGRSAMTELLERLLEATRNAPATTASAT